jgi:hypothetical protein
MPKIMHQESPPIVRPRRESVDIPDTPEARAHAEEAVEIRGELEAFGIDPEQVAPTRDGRGHVRLSFAQVRKLLGL